MGERVEPFNFEFLRGGLFDRLRQQRAAIASVVAMSIKGTGALLSLGVFTLAARAMSADQFGHLAVWFNAMSLVAVAAVFGQETLIIRSWGEYCGRGEYGEARRAYRFGWRVTLSSAAIFVIGVYVVARLARVDLTPVALYAALAFLFAQTLLHYSSHSSRVIAGFLVAEINRETTWRWVLLAVVAWTALHRDLTLEGFFFAAVTGMALSLLFQSLAVWRKLARVPIGDGGGTKSAQWFFRGGAMWLSAMVEAVSQYADVMLIGYFASSAAAGNYFVAARIANVFIMILTGLHAYTLAHAANLYYSNKRAELQKLLRSIALVGLGFMLPLIVVIIVVGPWLLEIFGARFVSVYPTLLVLGIASFVRALCGPAPGVLLVTGHERLYSWVITVTTVARLALTAVLAAKYGAYGAAWGWAIGNVPLAIGLAVVSRAVCGIDASVMAVFARRPAAT